MSPANSDPSSTTFGSQNHTPSEIVESLLSQEEAPKGKLRERIVNIGRAAVIAAEVSPANEVMRLSAFGVAQAISGDPAIGALAYGGSTLAIEGAAGVATAGALETDTAKKSVTSINKLLEKIGIDPNVKTSRATKAATALLGGTAVSMALKHREEPGRTKEQNREYGFRSAASLAGVCAVQGYLMSKGISAPSPETIGGGLAAVVGTRFGANRVIKHIKKRRESDKGQKFSNGIA